ncbi:MAG: response regulator transcription factor [Sulfurimonas sp.]|jgi:DNA-binding response OmpR family regulator|nr:response regulator transcription factor [Sulfurimonas sp.]MBU3939451.1 response regulator transcription factor [bacterium]MBU4024933.1 response regulator transcription factor [bacterium]MBU4058871.1 response regulator transcription factor [bacterium]MBU4110639.1 response regulator transcription factor [bacterium]
MKILLMEDDAVLSDILIDFLSEFWDVDYAYDSKAVYAKLDTNKYDLFIFDINVPGKNGLKLLEELRGFQDTTPAIFITAYTDTKHLQEAFSFGAHDYIKKPFELEELNARILNTKRLFNIETKTQIELAVDLLFFPNEKKVFRKKEEISLSTKDSALLLYFFQNQKRVITNEELIQNIWDFDSIPSDATIRSHIRTLREFIPKENLRTIRGEGYIYE